MSVLVSGLPKRNGWTIAEHAGDRAPDRTHRLLNRAVWDTFAAMGVVRRFAVIWSVATDSTVAEGLCACGEGVAACGRQERPRCCTVVTV
jgi:hypothetical protein